MGRDTSRIFTSASAATADEQPSISHAEAISLASRGTLWFPVAPLGLPGLIPHSFRQSASVGSPSVDKWGQIKLNGLTDGSNSVSLS